MTDRQRFVIVGASLAGAKAAETLRSEGFEGDIALLGEEPDRPYERPPLSKDYLRGESSFEAAAVHSPAFYEEHAIELLLSTRVVSVDSKNHTIEVGDSSRSYDRLLLTTGSAVRKLAIPGGDLDGVYYLRSRANADALHDAIDQASRVVVIGAGWIGSEVAASARVMGKDVSLIEVANVPLERVLGAEVGLLFADLHRDHGIDLHLGVGVDSLQGKTAFEAVRLADGTEIGGDLVVIGVGVSPRTELAEGAGLDVDNGVLVDDRLRTSDGSIWAAGDVANSFHPVFGHRIRLEHWSAALNQGPVAAKNMLDRDVADHKVPYFFSDQYELGMEYSGFAMDWDEIVYRGDREQRELIVFWCKEGRVLAGMNINVWDVADDIARLVASRRPIDAAKLADPDTPLAALLG